MRYKQAKKFYKRHETIMMVSVIIIGLLGAASVMRLQASFSTSGIWEASAEVAGVSISGAYTSYDSLSAIEKSKTKVSWDPDGWATRDSLVSMSSPGLKPQVEVTVGSLFHVDKIGTPIKGAGPNEIEEIDGVNYVRYYLGFSVSLLTRGTHPDISLIAGFDYYGETIPLYENPNFASVNLGGDIGIKLVKLDDTVPTVCGVQSFTLLDYETRYTSSLAQGYAEDISDFNRVYDWEETSHLGSVTAPDEYNMYSYYSLDAAYSGKVNLESTLTPASEYTINRDFWGAVGGTFNVWDVELLAHFMCEVLLTYEIAADTDGYLEGRLDIGGLADPEVYDFFYFITQFFSSILGFIMDIFGLADIWTALLIFVGLLIAAIVMFILLKRMLFGRAKTRMVYGY